ncbi:S9 family peptidase [Trinickia sp. LjRoot230]|uniref:prolyl oligopeptidase family serine peptidase n=1 Tax=Trinickia sp. LjRoot230 TaxID=3342288 RepID=UPI003ED13F3E
MVSLGRDGVLRAGEHELLAHPDGTLTANGEAVTLSDGPPPARRDESAHLRLHGRTLKDPYQWMSEGDIVSNVELSRYAQAHDDCARARLDHAAARPALEEDVLEAATATLAAPEDVVWHEGSQFYWRTPEGQNTQKCFVRDGLDGDERQLFDPDTQSPSADRGLTVYSRAGLKSSVSPDGKHVVIPLSNGNEDHELIVVDTEAGSVLADSIEISPYGSITWLDESTFVYPRLAGVGETPAYSHQRLYRHVVGTDMRDDVPVFGDGVQADVSFDEFATLAIRIIGDQVFGTARNGVSRDLNVFVTSRENLLTGESSWRKIIDASRKVIDFNRHGDDWVMMTRGTAQRERRILRVRGMDPDWDTATLAVPGIGKNITGMYLKKDALYVTQMANAMTEELWRVPLSKGDPAVIFSVEGTISQVSSLPKAFKSDTADSSSDSELLVEAVTWTGGNTQSWRVTSDGAASAVPSLSVTFDFSAELVAELKYAESPGGGRAVPVIVVHRRDLDRDETHIAKLVSYGGYEIRVQPTFFPHGLDLHSLVGQRDAVLAYADVLDGAADEVNAAAQMLIDEGYTSKAQLTRSGFSRGGATVGLAAATRPDLSRQLLLEHGVVDVIGHEFTRNGPANTPEFGSVSTLPGLEKKLRIDPYRTLPTVDFPERIMVTTGYRDNRVDAAGPCKLTAALQHANDQSGRNRDILLRGDRETAHFQLSRDQMVSYATDIGLFVLDAL